METKIDRLERLERRFEAAQNEMAAMRRRLRATWTGAVIGALGAFILGASPQARAQLGTTMQGLQSQINSLKTQVNGQTAQIGSLNTQVSSLSARLSSVEAKTAPISVSGSSFVITGMNVFIQDGTGSTSGTTGRGNLTIGYNAPRGFDDVRTGSHNLILGDRNNYSDYGGLVAGYFNSIGGGYATVTGGQENEARAYCSSVSGGYRRDIERAVPGPSMAPWTAGNLNINY